MKLDLRKRFLEIAVAFDVESHRIQPGLLTPPLVCASVARWNSTTKKSEGRLLNKQQAMEVFRDIVTSKHLVIVGANIAYDMALMLNEFGKLGEDLAPFVFKMYEEGRVFDIQIAEALHAVAIGMLGKDPRTGDKLRDPITRKMGRYSLSIVLDLVLHRRDAKVNDRFRESYALLEDTPLEEWPPDARIYPIDDACNTLDIALAQVGVIPRPAEHTWAEDGDTCTTCGIALSFGEMPDCPWRPWPSLNLHDVARQVYAALAMHLGAVWGFTVDPEAVLARQAELQTKRAAELEQFITLGLLRWKKAKGITKASKHTAVIKRATAIAYGCSGACPMCAGTQKVTSAKSGKPVGCRACDSTGLDLDSAPVPRTKGSKCRTCKSTRMIGPDKVCTQCAGQPEIIPGCSTSRDTLSETGAEDMINFAVFLEEAKLLETYIPFLLKGISDVPDDEDEEEGDDE